MYWRVVKFFGALLGSSLRFVAEHSPAKPFVTSFLTLRYKSFSFSVTLALTVYSSQADVDVNPNEKVFILATVFTFLPHHFDSTVDLVT